LRHDFHECPTLTLSRSRAVTFPRHHAITRFETAAERRGFLQDELRRDGLYVIGGSAYGDQLENDRAFAQRVLEELGLSICKLHEFAASRPAIDFLEKHPGRYVLKFNGPTESFVGRLADYQVDTRSAFPGSSGSRAMLTAIRRTSSSVSIFACSASVALSSSSLTRSWLRWGVAPNKLLVDRPKRRIVRVNDARLRGKIWRVARPRRRAKLHPLEARTHVSLFFPIRMAGHVAAPGRSSRKH
jgi:hypothetical protein